MMCTRESRRSLRRSLSGTRGTVAPSTQTASGAEAQLRLLLSPPIPRVRPRPQATKRPLSRPGVPDCHAASEWHQLARQPYQAAGQDRILLKGIRESTSDSESSHLP
jgi:hypothetical protein